MHHKSKHLSSDGDNQHDTSDIENIETDDGTIPI